MRDHKQPPGVINDLNQLNIAMTRLTPAITGISSSMLEVPAATAPMLNAEIAANTLTLYNGMKRADILTKLKPGLTARVNTTAMAYSYDVHGEKHFPGGPKGTKFNAGKDVVNPILQALIDGQRGRIRRDAKGTKQSYYLTSGAIPQSGGSNICIQVDYLPHPELITFHGYPDDGVVVLSLSRQKCGVAIAQ